MKQKRLARQLLICYALGLALWLLYGLATLLYDKTLPGVTLYPAQGQAVELEAWMDGEYLTTGYDPQLIFEGLDVTVRRVALYAEFNTQPGEMALYYSRAEGQGFAASRRAWGYLREAGVYEYTLPPGRLSALRIDPGAQPGLTVAITAIELNPARGAAAYFTPTLAVLLGLAVLPPLALAGFYTIIELWRFFKERGEDGQNG